MSVRKLGLFFTWIAACSGNTGPGHVDGTIDGKPLTVAGAFSTELPFLGAGTPGGAIVLSDRGSCDEIETGVVYKDNEAILIQVAGSTPGTYTVLHNNDPANPAFFLVTWSDDTCQEAKKMSAISGTVTIDAVDGGVYRGSFDVTLESGEHITGAFDPTACPGASSGTPRTCR